MTRHILNGDSATRKAAPMARGFLHYFPNAVARVSHISLLGNLKHCKPSDPLNWAFEKSNDHADCVVRHVSRSGRRALDDNGEPMPDGIGGFVMEDDLVAWRAMALLETSLIAAGAEPGPSVRIPPTEAVSPTAGLRFAKPAPVTLTFQLKGGEVEQFNGFFESVDCKGARTESIRAAEESLIRN